MTLLTVHGLDVSLAGRPVLRGVDFEAKAGSLMALVGPNGAGKSTLLRALCGLIPTAAGTVEWEGRSMAALDLKARARALAFLPQAQTVHWPLTVRRLVELGRLPRLGALSRLSPEDHAAVDRALAKADMERFADRLSAGLSCGELARALLARALAVEAPVLLADEPTASLDPEHALRVMLALRRLADEGALVIAAMHDLPLAAQHCDRVLMLDDGQVAGNGSPAEVLTPERLRRVYRIEATGPITALWTLAAHD